MLRHVMLTIACAVTLNGSPVLAQDESLDLTPDYSPEAYREPDFTQVTPPPPLAESFPKFQTNEQTGETRLQLDGNTSLGGNCTSDGCSGNIRIPCPAGAQGLCFGQ